MLTEYKIIVRSERLYLRDLNFSDQMALFTIYSDKEAMKFRSSVALENLEEAKKMIEKTIEQIEKGNEFRYGIIESETNRLIGTFLYKYIDNTSCEIGYSIGKSYWKLGYGNEILIKMLNYLHDSGFKNIIATTKKENLASIKLLYKVGFKLCVNEDDKELNLFKKEF